MPPRTHHLAHRRRSRRRRLRSRRRRLRPRRRRLRPRRRRRHRLGANDESHSSSGTIESASRQPRPSGIVAPHEWPASPNSSSESVGRTCTSSSEG
eukprot:7388901-Prymnesium_polylepis.1